MFQSTLPRRERQTQVQSQVDNGIVSIHAPAKGATKTIFSVRPYSRFNPRSREGSDVRSCPMCSVCTWFQSTLPRRERQNIFAWSFSTAMFQSTLPRRERLRIPYRRRTPGSFNPRSREGSDRQRRSDPDYNYVSIHAPAKGAT